jgi:hypothetical protein
MISLGVLLADDRQLDQALSAIGEPETSRLFLMHRGVRVAHHPALRQLHDRGLEITLCATDAEFHQVAVFDGGPSFGSQYDHAAMMRDAAAIVAITERATRRSHPKDREGARRARVELASDDLLTLHQGVRSALTYAACGLSVELAIDRRRAQGGSAIALAIDRGLAALESLGQAVQPLHAPAHQADIEVVW